jgi:hypothetical protein
MAASVLGKRQRQSTIAEGTNCNHPALGVIVNDRYAELIPTLRSRRRRVLDSTPSIYTDSDGFSKTKTPQDAGSAMDLDGLQPDDPSTTRPTATRNVWSKHTVRNKLSTVTSNEPAVLTAVSQTVAGRRHLARRSK